MAVAAVHAAARMTIDVQTSFTRGCGQPDTQPISQPASQYHLAQAQRGAAHPSASARSAARRRGAVAAPRLLALDYEHLRERYVVGQRLQEPPSSSSPRVEGEGRALANGTGANIGADQAVFEPIHGTAPDIMGQNIINPTATIRTATMMLRHLGYGEAADQVDRAIDKVYQDSDRLTPDQGGTASTTQFCEAILERLRE